MIPRYAHPQMDEIWNPDAEIDRWCQVETMAMQANPLAGDAWQALDRSPRPTQALVRDAEQRVGHEVVAFLQVWSELIPAPAPRQWLHYGLTSSDVIDTAQSLALACSIRVLSDLTGRLQSQLRQTRHGLSTVNQIGRTHGRWATMRPVGHPLQVAIQTLGRVLERMPPDLELPGKLSGPVGTAWHEWEPDALVRLDLEPIDATQIIPRDHLSAFAATCADLATVCEGLATQVRLLSTQGIDEVLEGDARMRIGSSAMPGKRNPILAENICGLARLARAAETPLRLGLVQWGDRDLAHSSVERVALPDLCHLTATCLERTTQLIGHLSWNTEQIATNARAARNTGGAYGFERVMEWQRRGLSYIEAHKQTGQELADRQTTTAQVRDDSDVDLGQPPDGPF